MVLENARLRLLIMSALCCTDLVSSTFIHIRSRNAQAASHASSPANSLRGRLAAAPLPGTTRVLLRSVGGGAAGGSNTTVQLLAAGSSAGLQLVNCTSLLCPLATETTRDEVGGRLGVRACVRAVLKRHADWFGAALAGIVM